MYFQEFVVAEVLFRRFFRSLNFHAVLQSEFLCGEEERAVTSSLPAGDGAELLLPVHCEGPLEAFLQICHMIKAQQCFDDGDWNKVATGQLS